MEIYGTAMEGSSSLTAFMAGWKGCPILVDLIAKYFRRNFDMSHREHTSVTVTDKHDMVTISKVVILLQLIH